jgi:hypothetical protein
MRIGAAQSCLFKALACEIIDVQQSTTPIGALADTSEANKRLKMNTTAAIAVEMAGS